MRSLALGMLLGLAFMALFAVSAHAQTCDQTLKLTAADADGVFLENTLVYKRMDPAELKGKMDFRQGRMLKVASHEADHGGVNTVTLAAFDSCGGKTETTVWGGVKDYGVKHILKAGSDTELALDFKPRGKRTWGK